MCEICEAKIEDFESFYSIKSEEDNIFWCGYVNPPNKNNLYKFWERNIYNSSRRILLVKVDNNICGYIYLDRIKDESNRYVEYEISIGISTKYSGHGIATNSLRQVISMIQSQNTDVDLIAYIREDNNKSQRVFSKLGFKKSTIYRMQEIETQNDKIRLNKWFYVGANNEK